MLCCQSDVTESVYEWGNKDPLLLARLSSTSSDKRRHWDALLLFWTSTSVYAVKQDSGMGSKSTCASPRLVDTDVQFYIENNRKGYFGRRASCRRVCCGKYMQCI